MFRLEQLTQNHSPHGLYRVWLETSGQGVKRLVAVWIGPSMRMVKLQENDVTWGAAEDSVAACEDEPPSWNRITRMRVGFILPHSFICA